MRAMKSSLAGFPAFVIFAVPVQRNAAYLTAGDLKSKSIFFEAAKSLIALTLVLTCFLSALIEAMPASSDCVKTVCAVSFKKLV